MPLLQSGMSELETDHEIGRASIALPMGLDECAADFVEAGFILFIDNELIRIGSAIGPHRP